MLYKIINNYASKELYEKINRTNKVDLIISGHDHEQQHIYIPNKPNMIISGVGGRTHHENPITISNELKYRSTKLGCCVIDFTKKFLQITFYNFLCCMSTILA